MTLRRRFPGIARGNRKAKPVGKAVKHELRKRIVTEKVFRDFAEILKGRAAAACTMEYVLDNLCSRQTRNFVNHFIKYFSIESVNLQALQTRILEYAGRNPELRAKRLQIVVEVSRKAVHELNTVTDELYKMAQTPEALAEHGDESYNIRHFVCLLTVSTANDLSTLGHRAHKMLERIR